MLAQLGLCSFRKLILQVKDEIRWNDEFKEQKFFSHGTTFSWAAATVNFGTKSFKVEDRKWCENRLSKWTHCLSFQRPFTDTARFR